MIKKRLSKKIWYGSDVDSDGKPVLPPLAKDSEDLEGLHYGELYLHIADDKLSLWTRTLTDQIKQIGVDGSSGDLWKLMETEQGEKYIYSAFNVVTQLGLTTFTDGSQLDLPGIYDGLPIDMDTLYWVLDENGKKLCLKAKGGEGNGSFGKIETLGEGNAITKVEVIEGGEGEADKLVFTKEKVFIDKETIEKDYLTKANIEENYYTKKTTDETFFKKNDAKGLFVTLDETTQEILGVKTFKNGLNIGSSKIWQSQSDVVYIDANLVVRGGVTMYGLNKVDVPTIMAGVAVDDVTISKKNGYLEVIGGGGGSIEYPLTWSGYSSGSWDGSETKNIYIPSKVSELANDSGFITSSALNGYATESWVKNQGYALASALGNYLPLTGGTITGNLTVNGDLSSGGNGDFAGYLTCRGNLNISGASGVNTSINFYSYDQSGYQFSNRVYDDKTLSIYYRSSAGAFTEVMKISATGLTEMIGYNDPVLSLIRTHPDGGAYINFCSKNQKTIRIAAGADTSYRFSVWYQNTVQGIDKYIMHVDPSGNLLAYGGITMYSDERKKTILSHVQLSLREVADAPLIEHYYNSDAEKTTHVGSIAQYWAGLNDWFCKMDADGFYTMEVQNAALASAISVARELLKYETKTDKQIRKLKKRISELEEEVELLKKM